MSRSLADTVRLREDLNFTGIRFVAVSQGIDSDDEQADVMMTVHGLVDSLYKRVGEEDPSRFRGPGIEWVSYRWQLFWVPLGKTGWWKPASN